MSLSWMLRNHATSPEIVLGTTEIAENSLLLFHFLLLLGRILSFLRPHSQKFHVVFFFGGTYA